MGAGWMSAAIVFVLVTAVCWVSSTAPTVLVSWVALIAGLFSLGIPTLAVAIGAFVGGMLAVRWMVETQWLAVVNVLIAAVAMGVASRSQLEGPLGTSTVVALALGTVLVLAGISGSRRLQHRHAIAVVVGVVVLGVVSTVAFGIVATRSVDGLSEGNRLVRQGLRSLGDGDIEGAQAELAAAQKSFEVANERLTSPLGVPASAVPVVAQHRSTAIELSTAAGTAVGNLAAIVGSVDPESLRLVDGAVDLDAMEDLGVALDSVLTEMSDLERELADAQNRWLLGPVTERIVDLEVAIDDSRARVVSGIETIDYARRFLGASEARHYLVMFTTPAEARGLGGFTGNWAEITVDDGRVELTDFGRSDELDEAVPAGERELDADAEWMSRYGRYGFDTAPGGTVGADPFKNVTMSPAMETTGEVIAQLYEQSTGTAVDGVIAADVYVLARLLRFTGKIEIENSGFTVGPENAPRFLLNRQYSLSDKDERIDLIETVSRRVVDQLLRGVSLPPLELIDEMSPLAAEGRLAAYARNDDEQEFLERIGAAGTMLRPETDSAIAVGFNNVAGSKIDYFMNNSATYTANVDGQTGTTAGTLSVRMENASPLSGQPDYVIGNSIREPAGTNRTYVSIFSRLPITAVRVDGVPVDAESGIEFGYEVASVTVTLPAGATSVVEADVGGAFDTADGYSIALRSPPTASTMPIDLTFEIIDEGGVSRTEYAVIDRPGVERFDFELRGDNGEP